jgi:hypothetical protein
VRITPIHFGERARERDAIIEVVNRGHIVVRRTHAAHQHGLYEQKDYNSAHPTSHKRSFVFTWSPKNDRSPLGPAKPTTGHPGTPVSIPVTVFSST